MISALLQIVQTFVLATPHANMFCWFVDLRVYSLGPHSNSLGFSEFIKQGEVTLIDSVLTPATAVKNFDLEFGPLYRVYWSDLPL